MRKSALLSAVCLLPLVSPALSQNAGVTAAVNQSATGTPPGRSVRTVSLGDNIVQNERIVTDSRGLVQILLADGTAFTVAPNSALTIDRFVYDPQAGTAEIAASLSQGVFRFVGGRTSKTPGGVNLRTPVGTVGIRGAVADLTIERSGQATISLIFGDELTLTTSGGETERLYRAGYTIVAAPGGNATVVRTPPQSASRIQTTLAGLPGTSGGSANVPDDNSVARSPVARTNSARPVAVLNPPVPTRRPPDPVGVDQELATIATLDLIRYQIALDLQAQAEQPPAEPSEPPQPPQPPEEPTPPSEPEQPPQPPEEPNPPQEPEQPPQPPEEPNPPTEPEQPPQPPEEPNPPQEPEQPPQPPEEPNPPTEPEQPPEPPEEPGPALRVYLGREAPDAPDGALDEGIEAPYEIGSDGNLLGEIDGSPFVLPVVEDAIADGGELAPLVPTYIGDGQPLASFEDQPLLGDVYAGIDGFRAYLLTTIPESSGLPSREFYTVTGTETDVEEAFAGGSVRRYGLQYPATFTGQYAIPFSSLETSGLPSNRTDLLIAEAPGSESSATRVLQISLGISATSQNQDSAINVVTGTIANGGIDAIRRGGGDGGFVVDTESYFGSLATLSGPDGGGFFGENGEYLVLSGTPGVDSPLADRGYGVDPTEYAFSDTYVAALNSVDTAEERRSGTLQGFNAGLVRSFEEGSGGGSYTTPMRSSDASETILLLKPDLNGLEGTFSSESLPSEILPAATRISVDFGGADGPSAYVSPTEYAATARSGGVEAALIGPLDVEADQYTERAIATAGDVGTYVVSGRAVPVEGYELCSNCDFLEWGWWGTRADGTVPAQFVEGDNNAGVGVHLGTWVAGDLTTADQLAPLSGSIATYEGGMLGTVRSSSGEYVARGNFQMNWDFSNRNGSFSASDFDGAEGSIGIAADSETPTRFRGSEFGTTLEVDGAFVNGPDGGLLDPGAAKGVIGNFDWSLDEDRSAVGVFGGTRDFIGGGA